MERTFSTSSLGIVVLLLGVFLGCAKQEYPDSDPKEEGAINLMAEARCSEVQLGAGIVSLSWMIAERPSREQRVEATKFRGGEFETIAQLPGDSTSVEWEGGEAGGNYYWRVLTWMQQGWVSSDTARFEAPICPVDMRRESQ